MGWKRYDNPIPRRILIHHWKAKRQFERTAFFCVGTVAETRLIRLSVPKAIGRSVPASWLLENLFCRIHWDCSRMPPTYTRMWQTCPWDRAFVSCQWHQVCFPQLWVDCPTANPKDECIVDSISTFLCVEATVRAAV